MPRSARTGRATMALALAIWSQACVGHRPPPADVSLLHGTRVRVRSAVPFPLSRPADTLATVTLPSVTAVEGKVRRVSGDTLVLERVIGVAAAPDGSSFRREREVVTLVRTSATEVTVRQIDWLRTTALLVGITVAVVGFLAYAASQIEVGFPDSGGGTFGVGWAGSRP